MFDSLAELAGKLAASGHFIDPVTTQVVFLAAKLQKPLLLEGPAGSGKTQLALSVAAAANTHVERLQCYRGVTEDKAIGRFDEGLQRLYMEFSKGQHESWQMVQANLKGRDFFRPGPLMRALECDRPCVLLIDELDKVDDGFEAMLLEILSAWQLSIPEFGTVAAKSIPFVVLTSNEERRLGDPIRRRSLYVRVEHPTPEREAEIIASRTPKADEKFHREMAGIALSFRNYSLEKPPSVSEMIDFANALQLLGTDHVTAEQRDVLLPHCCWPRRQRCGFPSRRCAGRTILLRYRREEAWATLVSFLGLPADPTWADQILAVVEQKKRIEEIDGIGCQPVLISATTEELLEWIGDGLRSQTLAFPEGNGSVIWPRYS